ncbi:glucosyl-dolichyl phosphate glucuronosyltransferase [Natronomonas sp.]|uniref:glucosyl-dolichyl phosphate glucuronosyltransferase n=1 Tax=Natronomonas sp. TaxID=2184060 RepID=UPI00397558D4
MKVSVVVCTYAEAMYDEFVECVESVLAQTHGDVEVVIVVDGTASVYVRAREELGEREHVVVHCNDENRGVSASRTRGAELASGDVVAFIDDDAVADPRWVEELVETYEERDALAVGGRMTGRWLAGRPWYLPEEFDWLVGVTYPGFAEAGEEVRNTFESNISFRREVFLELGGYDPSFGPDAESYSHSEGAEIGARLQAEYGRGVVYNPDAIVEHKVFEERIELTHLLTRAFQQGVSKRRMERQAPEAAASEESAYLRRVFINGVPKRVTESVRSHTLTPLGEAAMLVAFTFAVGLGYLYEITFGQI